MELGGIGQVADIVRPVDGPLDAVAAERRLATVRRWLVRRGLAPCGSGLRGDGRPARVWDLDAVRAELAVVKRRGMGALTAEERSAVAGRIWAARRCDSDG